MGKNLKNKKESILNDIKMNKFLYLLIIPGIIYFFVFSYLPMVGIVVAFQNFNPIKGVLGSEFIGFKNFEYFFGSSDAIKVTINTLYLNLLFLFTGLFFSIAIAIMLNEVKNMIFKKITQSIIILPHFLSWTVVAMFTMALLTQDGGLINNILKSLNLPTVAFYQEPKLWPFILVLLRLWKGAGFNSIIYLAAITSIDPQLYEAAKIDGANRWQCIFKITLPELKTTAVLLTLMGLGNIFHGDFGMIYSVIGDNSILYPTTDVIDTFVFRALRQLGDMGMSSAAGLYQSVVGFILVVIVNNITRKIDPDSALF